MILLGCGWSGLAPAHDFWLEAHPFYTSVGKSVDISLHVGTGFSGDSLPNISDWYDDFSVFEGAQRKPVNGELGRDPAGYFVTKKAGSYAVGYQSTSSYAELDPATFMKYMTEEGLDNALLYRQQHKLMEQPAKENFIRHAKALIQAGDQFKIDSSGKVFGYALEIIPLQNPYRLQSGAALTVQILYQGQPAANVLLQASSKPATESVQRVRSNEQGQATIILDQAGAWLLKAVKIVRLNNQKADWQSHWASLTFEMRRP